MFYKSLCLKAYPFLQQYVSAVYTITADKGYAYTTIPGGHVGLSVTLEGQAAVRRNGHLHNMPEATVYGLIKSAQEIHITEHLKEVTIDFDPYFFQLFVAQGMDSFTDGLPVDACAVFGRDETEALCSGIRNAENEQGLLRCIEVFLMRHHKPNKLNAQLHLLLNNMRRQHQMSVAEHSAQAGVSTVKLRNLFRYHVGLSPKDVLRIGRIQNALHTTPQSDNLTGLTYKLGYFDQAHFIHDFKKMTGFAPLKYFSNQRLVFDFYNFGRWRKDSFDKTLL